jgi:HlyD family secretion protein
VSNRHGAAAAVILRSILLIVLVCGLSIGLISYFNRPRTAQGAIDVSGRIEGYETNVGAKIGGRVDLINHREGEHVKANEVIAQISDADIQAQLRGAEARIERAREQVESSSGRLSVIESQIEESKLRVCQSKEDSSGKIGQWESAVAGDEARVAQVRSELSQAQADLNLARIRKERYEFLIGKEAVTRDEYDQAASTFEAAKALVEARKAGVTAAEKELKSAVGQLAQARSSRLSPFIESAARQALERQLQQARHDLKQAEHEVGSAVAERDQIKANIAYLKIFSPIDGIVTARPVEPGAVLVPGQTILSVINLDAVYLRAYVPEGQIGKVRHGQTAKVILDASPDRPLTGKVIQIDPEGSFTPENIYFKNDRVKQVFGIKIGIDQPGGYAKPGMPADAEIKVD